MLVDHFPWLFPCFFPHKKNARLLKVVPQFACEVRFIRRLTGTYMDLYGLMAMWNHISGEKIIPKIHWFFHWLIIIFPLKHSNQWLYFPITKYGYINPNNSNPTIWPFSQPFYHCFFSIVFPCFPIENIAILLVETHPVG